MRWPAHLSSWRRHSRAERLALVEAFFELASMRCALRFASFRRICGWLGLVAGPASESAPGLRPRQASAVGWAIRAAAARTPWDSRCLAQALAASRMLRRRNIPHTVHLGVATQAGPTAAGDLAAHAWLTCGDQVLIGETGLERFAPLASFDWGSGLVLQSSSHLTPPTS